VILELILVVQMLQKKYFTITENGDCRVSPLIKSTIDFTYLNLADFDTLKKLGTFDIIFCRNVMIYFDNEFKKKFVFRIIPINGNYS
jgi:chemotaxis protein methyltransferase CheR